MAGSPTTQYYPKRAEFPIEFSGSDPNGHHAVYFVKPDDVDSSTYRLHLGIRNVWHDELHLSPITPSATSYHLRLRFRSGLVDGRSIRKSLPLANEVEQQLGQDWRWHDLATDPSTGEVSVCFSFAPQENNATTFEWRQGQTLGIQLRPFKNAPHSGAFFLKTELDYGMLPGLDDAGYKITSRELSLAVVDLSGKTFFPGKAAVVGSDTILNNGQPNSRTIKLWNTLRGSVIPFRSNLNDHESGSTITVAIRCHDSEDSAIEDHPSVLAAKNELQHMPVSTFAITGASEQPWNSKPHLDVKGWMSWEITPKPEAGITLHEMGQSRNETAPTRKVFESLEFRLSGLQTTAPDGVANIYVHFHHLPGFADHTLIVPVEKTPLVIRGQSVGIGAVPTEDTFGADLYVAGDIRVIPNQHIDRDPGQPHGGDLHVGNDLTVTGKVANHLTIEKDLTVSEDAAVHRDLSVKGALRVEGNLAVDGKVTDAHGGALMPVGAIIAYGGRFAPRGWLLCDGSAISSSYADLRGLLSNDRTPDLRSRFVVGVGKGEGNDSQGHRLDSYSRSHTGGSQQHRLTEDEMPGHSHNGKTANKEGLHNHSNQRLKKIHYDGSPSFGGDTDEFLAGDGRSGDGEFSGWGSQHEHNFSTNSAGSGHAHNNLPPFYALTYIIKA